MMASHESSRRQVGTTMRVVYELERIGDHAVKTAEQVYRVTNGRWRTRVHI